MSVLAGLAGLDHPYVTTHPAVVIHGPVAAVPQTPGRASREDRYRLVADWCAAGPFLPLAWRLDVPMSDFDSRALARGDEIRGAIEAVAGLIEFAVRIERGPLSAPHGVATGISGRAYLRSLKAGQQSCQTALAEILVLARACAWTVALVNQCETEASFLIGCRVDSALCLRNTIEALGGRHPELRFVIAGPFPPFGAGAQALARAGFPQSGGGA